MTTETQVGTHPLEFLFHPRGVAVAGASLSPPAPGWGGGGNMFIAGVKAMGYAGGLYPVNSKATDDSVIEGLRVYRRLQDIPGPVDYVISSVPATAVLSLLDDAAAKGVRAIHFYTAGFNETGDSERAEIEREMLRRARAAGIRLIGPNCMGLYCPEAGLSFNPVFPKDSGPVGVVSQSGLNAQEFVNKGAMRGLRFSRVISFGNATDLNEADFYEYMAEEPNTGLVVTYLEGVKEGPRMLRALKTLAARKPVVLLKGGATEAGSRAARSHTGSLAGSTRIWQAVARQAGAIAVESVDEACDQLVALNAFPEGLTGARIAIIGSGGGTSVLAADACDRAGIEVPDLPEETRRRLLEFTPVAGRSIRNPLDTFQMADRENFVKTVRIASEADNIDVVVLHAHAGWGAAHQDLSPETTVASMVEARRVSAKPVVVVVRAPIIASAAQTWMDLQTRCTAEGFPVFGSMEGMARTLRRTVDWRRDREGDVLPS